MMTSQSVVNKFIPQSRIDRPNFSRGSMGHDKTTVAGGTSPVSGTVVDRSQRESIQKYSKDAHFQFNSYSKHSLSVMTYRGGHKFNHEFGV